jgi:hypothetical protein
MRGPKINWKCFFYRSLVFLSHISFEKQFTSPWGGKKQEKPFLVLIFLKLKKLR